MGIQKLKRISYKLYLSLQVMIGVIGIGFFIYHVIAYVHDSSLAESAKKCVMLNSSDDFKMALIHIKHGKSEMNWLTSYEKLVNLNSRKLNVKENRELRMLTVELLERKCGEFISTHYSSYSDEASIYLKNMFGSRPAKSRERISYLGYSILIPSVLIVFVYGAMRWIVWLLREGK